MNRRPSAQRPDGPSTWDRQQEGNSEDSRIFGAIDEDEKRRLITRTLREAKAIARGGRPVCINVHLRKTDFRKGSISV